MQAVTGADQDTDGRQIALHYVAPKLSSGDIVVLESQAPDVCIMSAFDPFGNVIFTDSPPPTVCKRSYHGPYHGLISGFQIIFERDGKVYCQVDAVIQFRGEIHETWVLEDGFWQLFTGDVPQ